MDIRKIIEKIESELNIRDWTKYKLAKEANLPQSTITSLMSGRIKNPSMDSLAKIAAALDMTTSNLIGDNDFVSEKDELSERTLIRGIVDILKSMCDDEGRFPEELHEYLFYIFDWYYKITDYNFYVWYKKFLNNKVGQSEIDIGQTEEIFDQTVNFSTLKYAVNCIETLRLSDTREVLPVKGIDLLSEIYSSLTSNANKFPIIDEQNNEFKLPILRSIRAGQPVERIEYGDGYTFADPGILRGRAGFALRVKGDSMNGDRIYDGDLVIVAKTEEVLPTDIAVVAVDGDEATLKRVKIQGDTAVLIPSNPQYEPIILPAKDIQIIGKVVEVKFWPK